jgi:long-subunit acyl-CoA synthetase (AMP-forming)
VLHREGDGWIDAPDWRLDRQVIRLALILRERFGIQPGHTAAIVAPLGWEWVVAEFAAVVQGVVSVAIDPSLPDDFVAEALTAANPAIAFAFDAEAVERLARLSGRGLPLDRIIAFRGPASTGDAWSFTDALDLGGTLDSAERANVFRAQARALSPASPALLHATRGTGGTLRWDTLTQGTIMARVAQFWRRHDARHGDLAYIASTEVTLETRLLLYALTGDRFTTVVLGTAGREMEEIAELHPRSVVAPPAIVRRAAEAIDRRAAASASASERSAWAGALGPLARRLWSKTRSAARPEALVRLTLEP